MTKLYIEGITCENITSFFTTKYGASQTPYKNVKVREALGINDVPWITTRQVHEDKIAIIEEKPANDIHLDGYDGLITAIKGVCLVTAHGDCIPIQLYDPNKEVVAAIHGGWRGTALGIAGKAARIMREKYDCKDIIGYIGPGISLCCFEVGEEVYDAFVSKYRWAENFIEKGKREGKYNVDLKGINEMQLKEEGVKEIKTSKLCTCCREDMFFSYRRDKETKERMASGICLLDH